MPPFLSAFSLPNPAFSLSSYPLLSLSLFSPAFSLSLAPSLGVGYKEGVGVLSLPPSLPPSLLLTSSGLSGFFATQSVSTDKWHFLCTTREHTAERKKEKQQTSAMEHVKQEKAAERQQESRRTFEAWKSKKDERIRSTGTLYTYKEDSKAMRHQKPWCPARGVKYDYPKLKGNEMKPAKKTSRTGSAKSFYSESSTSLHSLVSDTASSAGNSRPVTSEGKLKTIQVCCQTLEYWCTCDNC